MARSWGWCGRCCKRGAWGGAWRALAHPDLESKGLDAVIQGMQLALPDDEVLIRHTDALYDGLYAYLRRETL